MHPGQEYGAYLVRAPGTVSPVSRAAARYFASYCAMTEVSEHLYIAEVHQSAASSLLLFYGPTWRRNGEVRTVVVVPITSIQGPFRGWGP
jgi:hypothetical protein